MKKSLSFFAQLMIISSFGFSVSACYNPLGGSGWNDNDPKPPKPVPKDISYYQALIEKTKGYVADCEEWISDIWEDWNNDEDGNISDEIYQTELDQVYVNKYIYQSQINEYQYQILLLEKIGDKFTLAQILEGISITTEKIINLQNALELEKKYPDDFSKADLAKISEEIKIAMAIKEMFNKLKEEEEENNVTINVNTF